MMTSILKGLKTERIAIMMFCKSTVGWGGVASRRLTSGRLQGVCVCVLEGGLPPEAFFLLWTALVQELWVVICIVVRCFLGNGGRKVKMQAWTFGHEAKHLGEGRRG